jgi:hypothetical protein
MSCAPARAIRPTIGNSDGVQLSSRRAMVCSSIKTRPSGESSHDSRRLITETLACILTDLRQQDDSNRNACSHQGEQCQLHHCLLEANQDAGPLRLCQQDLMLSTIWRRPSSATLCCPRESDEARTDALLALHFECRRRNSGLLFSKLTGDDHKLATLGAPKCDASGPQDLDFNRRKFMQDDQKIQQSSLGSN